MNPFIPHELDSTTSVVLKGWLRREITHEGWYAIKQRNQIRPSIVNYIKLYRISLYFFLFVSFLLPLLMILHHFFVLPFLSFISFPPSILSSFSSFLFLFCFPSFFLSFFFFFLNSSFWINIFQAKFNIFLLIRIGHRLQSTASVLIF